MRDEPEPGVEASAAADAARAAEIRRVFDFAIELDRLKAVLRRSRPVGLERYENSAEHSWHVAVLALLLARFAAGPVDVARVVEILLVHDVPEIDSGDRFIYARDPHATFADEEAAAERIFGLLPPALGERLHARWREYEARATPEARLAYAADRLMPVLHNLRGGGRSWREHDVAMESVKRVNAVIADACPDVWRELEPMIEAFFAGRGEGEVLP